MTKAQYFPWRFFFRLAISLFLVFSLLIAAALAVVFFLRLEGDSFYKYLFFEVYLWSLPVVLISSLWFSYRLAYQLGRIVFKARRIASRKFAQAHQFDERDLFKEEEMEEFVELASTLNRIHHKLKENREELEHGQEESNVVMSSVGDAVVRINGDQVITYFNSQFADRFMSSEQLGTEPLLAAVFREPEILDSFNNAIKTKCRQDLPFVRIEDDNADKYYSLIVNPLFDKGNQRLLGAIGTFHDITELKKAEMIRIEFVANASHELRTPLTSLKGYVDTLKEDISQNRFESTEKFVDIISKSINRLMELVNDLLTISTLEASKAVKKEKVDTEVLTSHVLKQFARQAEEKGIAIETNFGVSTLYGDGHKIEQVITNIISNGIKYIPSGKKIELSWVQENDDWIELRIKDNGPGIGQEHLSRIFERFYRVDRGRSRDAGGTGLGLAIVKHIMQSHGGAVRVRSDLGEGTEFTCLFPSGINNMNSEMKSLRQ